MELGELVKHARKEMGLTQKDLSAGICTQALISRIEKGDIIPKKSILDQLGKRLELSGSDLNQVTHKAKYNDEIHQVKTTIRKYLEKRDYETIELLLKHNEFMIKKVNDENDQAFFSWIKASIQDKLYGQKGVALKILNDISLEGLNEELVLEILNAIGVIYYQDNKFEQALNVFRNGDNIIDEHIDYKVQAKIMLNYALTLEETASEKEALEVVMRAIDAIVSQNSMFLLGDLYHTKGYLLRKLGHLEEAKKSNQLALSIFEIQKNNEFKMMTQLEIKEINDELQTTSAINYMS
jgi:transcriptional regulator with XRE-family HTH domain